MAEEIAGSSTNINNIFPQNSLENVKNGTLEHYQPALENTKTQLSELLKKQENLITLLHAENLELSWIQNSVDLHKMYDTIAVYQNKLLNIKKEMRAIHDKSMKLRKKALSLQQYKEKCDYIQNQQKELNLQKEQGLIGK